MKILIDPDGFFFELWDRAYPDGVPEVLATLHEMLNKEKRKQEKERRERARAKKGGSPKALNSEPSEVSTEVMDFSKIPTIIMLKDLERYTGIHMYILKPYINSGLLRVHNKGKHKKPFVIVDELKEDITKVITDLRNK